MYGRKHFKICVNFGGCAGILFVYVCSNYFYRLLVSIIDSVSFKSNLISLILNQKTIRKLNRKVNNGIYSTQCNIRFNKKKLCDLMFGGKKRKQRRECKFNTS